MPETPQIIINIVMGAIMLGIGIHLRFKDFYGVFTRPRAVFTGLAGQMIILPLLAFLLAWVWPMEPVFKVALVLLAACPGGTSSNLLTYMTNGKVALSVTLTAINSLLILFSIPLIINIAANVFLDEHTLVNLSFWRTFKNMLLTVGLPVLAGLLINEYSGGTVSKNLRKPLKFILPALLILIFVLAVFMNVREPGSNLNSLINLIPLTLILNVGITLIGYWFSAQYVSDHDSRITIAIEMGLQNSALAIFIATHLMNREEMAQLALVYASFSFFSTWAIVYWLKRRRAKNASAEV